MERILQVLAVSDWETHELGSLENRNVHGRMSEDMSIPAATADTRVLMSFSIAYVELAHQLADELRAAGLAVRYDQWEGGGGLPGRQSVTNDMGDVDFLLPLLTPCDIAPSLDLTRNRR